MLTIARGVAEARERHRDVRLGAAEMHVESSGDCSSSSPSGLLSRISSSPKQTMRRCLRHARQRASQPPSTGRITPCT